LPGVGEVGLDRKGAGLCRDRLGFFPARPVREENLGAGTTKLLDDRGADASRAAGDECPLALE